MATTVRITSSTKISTLVRYVEESLATAKAHSAEARAAKVRIGGLYLTFAKSHDLSIQETRAEVEHLSVKAREASAQDVSKWATIYAAFVEPFTGDDDDALGTAAAALTNLSDAVTLARTLTTGSMRGKGAPDLALKYGEKTRVRSMLRNASVLAAAIAAAKPAPKAPQGKGDTVAIHVPRATRDALRSLGIDGNDAAIIAALIDGYTTRQGAPVPERESLTTTIAA